MEAEVFESEPGWAAARCIPLDEHDGHDELDERGHATRPEISDFDMDAWLAQLVAELEPETPPLGAPAPGTPGLNTPSPNTPVPSRHVPNTTQPDAALDGVNRLLELRTRLAHVQAAELRMLASLAEEARASLAPNATAKDVELTMRSLTAELAVATRVSDRTMAARLAEAETVVNRFPATLAALESGSIGFGHLRTIVDHGILIADAHARARYEKEVLPRAVTVTPGRLRRFAQWTAARVGEVRFQQRHDAARDQRCVTVKELGDGMSLLTHTLPTVLAEGVWDRLTEQAKAIKNAADPRSYDQLRSDLATELLLTGQPSGGPDAPHAAGVGLRAEVSVVIPMLSLLGPGEEPATIAGRGPIDLNTARRLAAGVPSLVRILTHPVTGMALAVDSYRPSEQLRRFLRTRDGRCRFPSCNRNARRCDIDHTLDWDHGGTTRPENLECLCRGHHTLKHHTPWTVRQTAPGVLEWVSPRGRSVIDRPDTVFSAAPGAPPATSAGAGQAHTG